MASILASTISLRMHGSGPSFWGPGVGLELGPTHENARTRSERRHDAAPMLRPVRPVVAGQAGGEFNKRCPGKTRRGRCTQGCSRVGRPPRMPSNVTETKEEQQVMRIEELGFGDKSKDDKIVDWFVFDRLDTLNRPWPLIFIGWGGLAPQEILLQI